MGGGGCLERVLLKFCPFLASFDKRTVQRFAETSCPGNRWVASSLDLLPRWPQRASGRARSGEPQGFRCLRSPCPLAPRCPPPSRRRPPLTYRLKTREGFRRGVAALSPDTAATAERPAAVGERLQPRVASRPKSPAQRAGGGAGAGSGRAGPPGRDR